MIGKLGVLLSFEMFVLIAALFLLVYITKSQVSKWFTYASVTIVIVTILMMVCTLCFGCMHHMRGGMERECMEQGGPPHRMMMMHHGMMGKGNCDGMEKCEGMEGCKEMEGCKGMEGCKDKEECEDMPCCKHGMGMGKEKCMEKEIIITKHDSMPKKEVIIKKK
jgi:hypothetical protein